MDRLINVAADASPNPVILQVPESALIRYDSLLNNDNETTPTVEYRWPGFDRCVHRSSHVQLKHWPRDGVTCLGDLLYGRSGGITPTDVEPDTPTKRQIRRLSFLAGGVRMANTQAMCSSFKREILCGLHALGTSVVRAGTTADSFKAALMLASGSLGAGTQAYANTSELAESGNYTRTGQAVTNGNQPAAPSTTAYWTPSASLVWATLTASGVFDCMLLYNDTSSGKLAVAVFTFGNQQPTAGTFTLTMPNNDASNALIRIA